MSDHAQSTDEIKTAFAAGYDIERELLGGGMSRVFLANERALNRQVVIKVLPPELAAGVNRERFRREVQLAAQLQHPHIVPLYAAGAQVDLLYYTMPFIEGESLKQALQARTPFTPREVLGILHDVVDALGYAHARGVIHRDIKPGNVLRSGKHAVVTDFGVAKAISAAMPAAGMTTSGMAIGTPAYMAPEQLAGDPAADHRIDLYAVGLLAYELLAGETPFTGDSPQEALAAQLTRAPAPLDKVRRDVPPAFSALIMRCLAKRPEDRPQTAAELLEALDALEVSSGEFAAAAGSRRPWALLGAAALALTAIAVWQRTPSTPTQVAVVRDTVTVSPGAMVLTRAESLAIAQAVDARLGQQRAARNSDSGGRGRGRGAVSSGAIPSDVLARMVDSLREEIQRAVFDSLARVQQAPRAGRGGRANAEGTRIFIDRPGAPPSRFSGLSPALDSVMRVMELSGQSATVAPSNIEATRRRLESMGPARRVAVTEARTTSRALAEAATYGAMLADTLRRTIGASARFVLVNADSVAAALQKTRTIDDLSTILGADMFASITTFRTPSDSVVWQVTVRDLTAGRGGIRSWVSGATAVGGPIVGLDSLLAVTAAQLTQMDRAPRRREPSAPREPQ
ncbi:MAG: serine/threonine-protein kinase [Gemmatimonadetes bacterium]|nr:serine/threonine-protein kinase [Gemmatimonadota bacterium]